MTFKPRLALLSLRRALPGRRAKAAAASLTIIICSTTSLQSVVANGDTRTLYLKNSHNGEEGAFTFKKDGRYDPEVLKKLNWILRDWRRNEPTKMDPQLFDVVWEVYREVGAKEAIVILSGYRSPATNAMLRSRSKAVAEQSQHMRGKAMDFFIPGVSTSSLRVAGLRLQRGGVGFYPSSNFVHLDTGSVRMWPRMTRDQLVRVFPDEKTVHVPADGKPLANYQVALAELESRGNSAAGVGEDPGSGIRRFFASLFGKGPDEDEGADIPAAPAARTQVAAATPARPAPEMPAADQDDAVPTPPARPDLPQAQPATPEVRMVNVPLPSARPSELAASIVTAQATLAPLPNAPLPLRRPAIAEPVNTASIPPLPAVIVRGTEAPPEVALSYAPAAEFRAHGTNPLATLGAPKLKGDKTRTAEVPFGPLFTAPDVATTTYLRPPELRVFSSFMTAPREVVAVTFSAEHTVGPATTSFGGEAVAVLPTYAFGPASIRVSQRAQ